MIDYLIGWLVCLLVVDWLARLEEEKPENNGYNDEWYTSPVHSVVSYLIIFFFSKRKEGKGNEGGDNAPHISLNRAGEAVKARNK